MQPILEVCLVKNSINSPVSDLTPYKINPYVIAKVSTAFLSSLACHLIFQVHLCLDPSHQKPLVYSQYVETHNSYPFYWFSLCSQIPLHPSSFLVTSLLLGLQRITLHPQVRQINVPVSQGVCLVWLQLTIGIWSHDSSLRGNCLPFYTKLMHIPDLQSEPGKKKIYLIFQTFLRRNLTLSYHTKTFLEPLNPEREDRPH